MNLAALFGVSLLLPSSYSFAAFRLLELFPPARAELELVGQLADVGVALVAAFCFLMALALLRIQVLPWLAGHLLRLLLALLVRHYFLLIFI